MGVKLARPPFMGILAIVSLKMGVIFDKNRPT